MQSRGSDNPNTGPIRDHSSFTSNRVTGAFAYIDASPPRRPNDVAQIVSEEFTATGANRKRILTVFGLPLTAGASSHNPFYTLILGIFFFRDGFL